MHDFNIIHLLVAFYILIILYSVIRQRRIKKRIINLTNNALELTPAQFQKLKSERAGRKQIINSYDCPGVYILYNKTKNMYYVGQGKKVINRVSQHFTGHGNGDVYADWKYGNDFTIRIIKLEGSGFGTLNALERNTIATYNAFSKGYNKTRGNKG